MKMHTLNYLRRTAAFGALVLATMGSAACGLDNNAMPAQSGPSTLGLSVVMTASPDQLPRDGSSQSVITLTARDAQGRAVAGQRVSLSLEASAPQGASISQTEVTTGSGGQASFAVTAPTAGSIGDIMILATPIGGDANNATVRAISIAAIPRNNSAPQFPNPPFTVSCASSNANCVTNPEVGEAVTFDASGVTDEGIKCNSCIFRWNFGGEATATGQIVTHAFSTGGGFVVTLTVTDAGGITASAQRTVTVSVPGPATVSFSVAPVSPIAGQTATFTSLTTPSPNHRIVSFAWTWGDGASSTTAASTIQHVYDQAGRYPVTLTVRDDLGQSATVTTAVVVNSGLVAVLTQSPAGTLNVGQTAFFDGSGSISNTGTAITNYLFDFGDGTTQSSSFSTAKHEYAATGTYTVKLTITDEKGRTASTTTVGAGAGSGNVVVQ
jgi:PKD repeat protein